MLNTRRVEKGGMAVRNTRRVEVRGIAVWDIQELREES